MDISNLYNRATDAVKKTPADSTDKRKLKYTAAKEQNKYNIKNHCYPLDLMGPDGGYGGHYVVFYINTLVDSKLVKDGAKTLDVKDYSAGERGYAVGANMSKEGLVASSATVAGAEALLVGGIAGGAKTAAKALALGAGTAAVSTGVVASIAPSANRAQRRLQTAIALHVPNQMNVRYGVQWSEEDITALLNTNAFGTEIMKAIQSDHKSDVIGKTSPLMHIAAAAALSKGPQAAAVSAATGLAANPKKEQVFKGVDFRTFNFEYQFFPRNEDEASNVLNIIESFKYHMHPEFKDGNNFVYLYPSEFDIVYFSNGEENTKLHRHTSCVLTDISVNYTPNGMFATFSNGMPTQINISMNFRELALLTKDHIERGL